MNLTERPATMAIVLFSLLSVPTESSCVSQAQAREAGARRGLKEERDAKREKEKPKSERRLKKVEL